MSEFEFDAFISHASEDKADFVEPLASELKRWGLRIWYDKFSLKVGDSLRDSIESGLSRSRFGVVVFSPSFVEKSWPKSELNGLFAREMDGKKVILPIWHKITSAEMKSVMPIQSDKVALHSEDGVASIAKALIDVIRPELLELEVQRASAVDAGKSFIETARAKYPGYDFTVHSGAVDAPLAPKTVASVTNLSNRIDMRVSDAGLIEQPPSVRISLTKRRCTKVH